MLLHLGILCAGQTKSETIDTDILTMVKNSSLEFCCNKFKYTPCISDPLYRPRWRPQWVKTTPRPSPLCECCTPLPADILVTFPLLGTRTGVKPRSRLSFPRHPHSPLIISQKIPAPRRGKMPNPGPRLPKMIPANSRFYPNLF